MRPDCAVRAPRALPILGHAPTFVRDKLGFLRHCHDSYGDAVRLQIGGSVWLLNDPADVHRVLVGNARNYEKTPKLTSRSGRELSGSGLHTAVGRDHLSHRRMVQPLFHAQRIVDLAGAIDRESDTLISRWSSLEEIDLFDEMMKLAQRVMLKVLFGDEFEDIDGSFAAAITTRRRYIEHFFISNLPFPEHLPLPVVWRFGGARTCMNAVIEREIARRRRAASCNQDLLSMLIAARGKDGARMSDEQVRDEAVTITTAGYETIGAALAWTLHLIHEHPEVAKRVADEVGSIAAFGRVDPHELGALEYTRMVLDESLRLYPPTWIFVRVANAEDELPSGTRIHAGEKIYLCPYTMHRHPRYYVDPDRFDPERFSARERMRRPKLAFLPFGAGPRLCIGEPLARLEAMIVISRVVQHFDLEPLGGAIHMRPSIVLEPQDGLRVRLRRRRGDPGIPDAATPRSGAEPRGAVLRRGCG